MILQLQTPSTSFDFWSWFLGSKYVQTHQISSNTFSDGIWSTRVTSSWFLMISMSKLLHQGHKQQLMTVASSDTLEKFNVRHEPHQRFSEPQNKTSEHLWNSTIFRPAVRALPASSRQGSVENAPTPLHQQPKEALVVVQQHQATRITRAPSDPLVPSAQPVRCQFRLWWSDEVTPRRKMADRLGE